MILSIAEVLNNHSIEAVIDVLSDQNHFESEASTAGTRAAQIKFNQHARQDLPEIKGASTNIIQALSEHPDVSAAAIPKRFSDVLFNRYDQGGFYGDHTDNAFISGVRTDLSFTLFLSKPESYEGGELVILNQGGEHRFKLAAGSMVLYPSSHIHRVEQVTSGTRLAAVGWIQSRVQLAAQREILFDLDKTLREQPVDTLSGHTTMMLMKTLSNLLRLWAD